MSVPILSCKYNFIFVILQQSSDCFPLSESIQSIRDWSPPAVPIDWDDSASDLKDAVMLYSYKRYHVWYRKFLKRVSVEDCSGGRTTGRAGRST